MGLCVVGPLWREGEQVEERRAANQEWRFIQFLRQLLAAMPGITGLEVEGGAFSAPDVGVDVIALYDGRLLLVEA